MNILKKYIFYSLLLASVFYQPPVARGADEPPAAIEEQDVLSYLEQAISLQRKIASTEKPDNAQEMVLKDALRQNTNKILQKSFDFARGEAIVLKRSVQQEDREEKTETESRQARIQKRMAEAEGHAKQVLASLSTVNSQLARASGGQRAILTAKKEKLESELNLVNAQNDLLKSVMGIFNNADDGEALSLSGKIANLARNIPELDQKINGKPDSRPDIKTENKNDASAEANDKTEVSKSQAASSQGIFGLIGDMFDVSKRQKEVKDLAADVAELRKTNKALSTSLRASLRQALDEGNRLAKSEENNNLKNLKEHKQQLDDLVVQYKEIGTALIPLGQTGMLLDNASRNLKEWSELIDADMRALIRRMLFRLAILAISILIPVILSELARRATSRYIHDSRRQKQLRITRQIVFGIVLALVIILNFVTEFGSLATFAGFLTAGLAVALQTVLLSLVAHFFFFGRFGVKVGDRVTISGTTGDVIQVGMLRIYLMELTGQGNELRPSGKIVAFPNSILFNPTAFFKQIPGTDYIWNEMTFMLDQDTDYKAANKKIMEAVDAVYGDYKEAIEHQHNALEQSTKLSVKMPVPKGELRFLDQGLAFVVRYPVVIKRVFEMQRRITRKLIDVFAKEQAVNLIVGNPFKIEAAGKSLTSAPQDGVD